MSAGRFGVPVSPVSWRSAAVPVLMELGRQETARELAAVELAEAREQGGRALALDVALRVAGQRARERLAWTCSPKRSPC